MASISEPYTVTTLPRISLPEDVIDCVVSEVSDKAGNYVDLGISGSIIGTYILRPTPKLFWSYAISPFTIVTALVSSGAPDSSRRFVVGLKENKKQKLCLIETRKQQSSGSDEVDIDQQSLVQTRLLTVPFEVVGLKFGNKDNSIFCLLSNGEVQVYNYQIDEEIAMETLLKIEGDKRAKVVYHQFLDEFVGSELSNVENYLLTVESTSAKFLTARVFAILSTNDVLEISQTTIEFKSKNFKIDFDPSGSLIIYDIESQTLSIFSLPNATSKKTISVSNRVKDLYHTSSNQISLKSAAPNRVLLAINDTILLIETKFEAVLATFTATSDSQSTFRLLTCETVKGNSLKTKETLFLALVTNEKDALTLVQNLSLDVGLGTLNNCLGKGINRIQKKTLTDEEFFHNEVTGLSSLLNENNLDDESFFLENSVSLQKELFEVYKQLRSAKDSNDISKWESIFLPYVKGFSLKDILNATSSELKEGKQDFQVFELEKDRVIDSRFFYKVASLIFTKDEEKNITLLSKDFVPEKTLTYLLTHPLFPMEFSNGLLQSLHKFPRLVRQAIVTCPNLSCFELIQQLNVIENEEIFKDLIIRLSEEYSSEKITSETTKIINTNNKKRRKSLQAAFDLDKIISKIITLNFGFEILNSFIDSNGLILSLHYSKSENNLENLINKIDNKANSLLINSQLLTLVEQSLANSSDFKEKKSNKKKKSRSKKQQLQQQQEQEKLKPLTISEDVDDTRLKLDSMLSIDKNNNINDLLLNSKNNNVINQLNKKVPSYSIDKLIL